MKSISYNSSIEISIRIFFVVFIIAIFTAVKIKELQPNDDYIGKDTKKQQIIINHNHFPPIQVLEEKLIKEQDHKDEKLINSNNYRSGDAISQEQELSKEIVSWISNSAYWEVEDESEEQDLAAKIVSWMNNSTYWEKTLNE